jgi:F-type H+-transporting ATPase subunit b
MLSLLLQEHGAESGASAGPLVVNGGLVIWTLVVFILLLLVLRKWAWPAILGAVEAREARLEQQLADAERMQQEAAALLEQHKKLIADSHAEAQGILAEARRVAEAERGKTLDQARREQEELLARARRELASERDRAIMELRREAVDISLAAASKLVGQRLDSAGDRKLVQEYLARLEAVS